MWALNHRHRNIIIERPTARKPTETSWETPRALVPSTQFNPNTHQTTDYIPNVTRCAEILDCARGELKRLCCARVPLSDLERFFVTWQDPANPKNVQPNALAWFQYATGLASTALGTAVGCGRIDAVRLLLENGLKPTEMDMFWALRAFDETQDRTTIEMFVDAGWNINQPLNEHTAPILA